MAGLPLRRSGDGVRLLTATFRWALLSGAILTLAGSAAWGQQDTVLVDAVIRMEIEDGPAEVVPALAYNGTLLLPLRRFLELSEIPLLDYTVGGTATALVQPGDEAVRFVPDSGRIVRGDSVLRVSPLDAVWRDGDLFVATGYLDALFGVATRVEWANLSAYIGMTAGLPVVRRARRERRRAILERPGRQVPRPYAAHPAERLADGVVLEWTASAPPNDLLNAVTLDWGLGGKLAGGSLELRHHWQSFAGGSVSQLRGSWSRAWPERKWLGQLGVGDVLSSGLRARSVQGFSVTNAPFIRASEFDVEELLGNLPQGWEVELYDRGRLRGYSEVDSLGMFELPLQLRYGQNPFDLVFYGPGGEVLRQTRTIRVPFSRLPAGRLEYAVAGGRCRFQSCDALFSSDVRYGLSTRVTLQAGSDYFWRDSVGGLWQPYAAASAALLPALRLTGEAVYNGLVRASAGFEPSPDLRVDLGHTIFDPDGSEFSRSASERRRTEVSALWRPRGRLGSLFFRATGLLSSGPAVSRSIQRISATTYLWRVRSSVALRHELVDQAGQATLDRSGIDLTAETIVTRPGSWLHATTARLASSADVSEGLGALSLSVGRQIAHLLRFDLGVGWLRDAGYSLRLDFTTIAPGPRFGSRSRVSSRAGSDGLFFFDGSVIVDPDSRVVRWSDGRDLGRAGIAGTVFLDENGNGKRDRDERGLEGIPVQVGGWYSETDPAGRFAAWDLFPFEASYIEVDTLALGDPRFVLPNAVLQVYPTPNSFLSVDVPVVVGAEVSGYVLLDGAVLAGIPVELRDVTTGATTSLLTYSDGGFYRLGVLPGEYDVTVPDAVLERLGAGVTPIRLSIPSEPGDKLYEGLLLYLEPIPDG